MSLGAPKRKLPKQLQRDEHDEQVALFAWAALHPSRELGLLFSIPNAGGYRGGFKANAFRVTRMKREGVKSGVPDLMLPVACHSYCGLFIEMKRADGIPSDVSREQKRWIEQLTVQGYRVVVAFGFEQAKAALLEYLSLT